MIGVGGFRGVGVRALRGLGLQGFWVFCGC